MGRWARAAIVAFFLRAPFSLPGQQKTPEPPTLSLTGFQTELGGFNRLAASCAEAAAACDAATVPDRQRVEGSSAGAFSVSWRWLRDALGTAAHTPSAASRLQQMQAVQAHIREWGQTAAADRATGASDFQSAKAAAAAVLRREEFRTTEGPSWLDRKVARLEDWFLRLLGGADQLGKKAPWLAPLIEWSCFALAASGLLFFLQRNLRRQALRISLVEGLALEAGAKSDPEDWARLAEQQAAAQDWRAAVHSLFWSAVALLSTRRLWRLSPARTPREYTRLLRPGSEAQEVFRALTRMLERTWYSEETATEADFREASALLERLRTVTRERMDRRTVLPASPTVAEGL